VSETTTLTRSGPTQTPSTTLSAASPDATADQAEVSGVIDRPIGRVRRALGGVIHVASWFYLSVLAFLLGWIVVVWALMGWSPAVVSTGSMQPAISPGDVVMTAPPDSDLVFEEGTVITFEDPARAGELVTHRIVALNDDGTYRTRGDNNGVSDSADLDPEDVVGVGRLLIPSVALPWVWFDQGRLGMLIMLALVTVAALWSSVRIPWDRVGEDGDHASL
jgi:signal peptidase I